MLALRCTASLFTAPLMISSSRPEKIMIYTSMGGEKKMLHFWKAFPRQEKRDDVGATKLPQPLKFDGSLKSLLVRQRQMRSQTFIWKLLQLQISAVSTSTGINNWANFRLGVQRGAKKSCMFELPDPVVLSRGQRKSSKRPCCNCNLFPNILAFILLSTWPVQCSSPPLLPTSEQSNSPLSPRIPDLVITNLVTAQF